MPCTTAPNSGTLFFFNDTATTEIYTLSLHDALPICPAIGRGREDHEGSRVDPGGEREDSRVAQNPTYGKAGHPQHGRACALRDPARTHSTLDEQKPARTAQFLSEVPRLA